MNRQTTKFNMIVIDGEACVDDLGPIVKRHTECLNQKPGLPNQGYAIFRSSDEEERILVEGKYRTDFEKTLIECIRDEPDTSLMLYTWGDATHS